ncbi:hypothetical protein AKJ16_DCAP14334 [Drosera capensis]
MFRLHKQKSDRPGGRFDFKFSGFHALKAPKGWDKLSLYFTSVETGKTISKLGKASVRNGECRWTETLSESLWVAQDGKESLYKFIISLGSTRSGILGEATINLAEHTSSKVSSNLLLPLENCSFGTSLEVKVHCLTPTEKFRDERRMNTSLRAEYGNAADNDVETKSSESEFSRSVGSNSSNHMESSSQQELGSREPSFSASGSHRSFDSVEGSSGKDFSSPRNSMMETESNTVGRQNSTTSQNSTQSYDSPVSHDANRLSHSPFNSKVVNSASPRYDQREGLGKNSDSHVSSPVNNPGSSKDLLEDAEIQIEELRAEARTWERNARKTLFEVESLKKELLVQSKKQTTLDMELAASHTERESLKQEIEHLKSLLEESMMKQKATASMELQVQDMDKMQKELEDEIRFLKESNANLEEQQQKTQESNLELISILKELDGIVETQKAEIEALSEKVKLEEISEFSEEEVLVEDATAGVMKSSQGLLLGDSSQLQPHCWIETPEELQNTIRTQEKSLEDKNLDLEMEQNLGTQSLLECEAAWRLKLAAKEEEIINLESKLSEALEDQGHRGLDVDAGDDTVSNKEVDLLKEKVEELERDCIELTEENLQLLLKLKHYKESTEFREPHDPVLDSSCIGAAENSQYAPRGEISQLSIQLDELQQEVNKKEALVTEMLASSDHSKAWCADLEKKCSDLDIQMQTHRDRALHLEDDLDKCHLQVEEQLNEIRLLQERLQFFEGNEDATRYLKEPAANVNSTTDSSADTFCAFSQLREELHDFLSVAKKHQLSLNWPVDHRCSCCFDDLKFTEPVTQAEQIEVMFKYISQLYKLFVAHSNEDGEKLCLNCEDVAARGVDDQKWNTGGISDPVAGGSEVAIGRSTETRKEIADETSEITALQGHCQPQEEEIEVLRQKKTELENQIDNLTEENSLLKDNLEIMKREKFEASQQLDRLKNEIMLLNSSMEFQAAASKLLERKSSDLEKGKQDLEFQLSELEHDNMDLSERMSAMEAHARYLTNEKESIRLELQHSENQITTLNDEIKKLETEIEMQKIDLRQKVQDMRDRWIEAQEESEYLKKSNQTLQDTVEKLIEECTSLQKSNADLRRQNTKLNSYSGALEAQLNDSLERFSDFSSKIDGLESDIFSMLEQVSLKEESFNSELASLVDANREYKDKIMAQEILLNQKYAEKVVEVENLQRELVHLIDQISAADDDKEKVFAETMLEVSSLRADKVKIEIALQELQGKLASLEKQHCMLQSQAEATALELKGELSASRRDQEVLTVEIEKLLSSLESVRTNEEKCKSMTSGLEKNLKASEFERMQLAEEISSLKSQLQSAASLQDEVLSLKSSLNEAKFENEKLKASIELLSGDHDQLKAEKMFLVQKVSSLDKSLSELDECQHAKATLEEKILRLEGDLSAREALCAQDAELKIELSRIKRTSSELQRKIKHLEEDKHELLERLHALESERKQSKGYTLDVSRQASMTCDVSAESPGSESLIIDNKKLTWISGKTSRKVSNSGAEIADYLSKIQYLERELAEAFEANDMYKTQIRRLLSDGQSNDPESPKVSASEDAAPEKRRGRSTLSLELELRDLRERYFKMSLKYAEVEAQREELVMKMKTMSTKRRWFS